MTADCTAYEQYARTIELFADVLRTVPGDAWSAPTPCAGWDIRALVNHVVGEDRWAAELLTGRTIADIGATLDGDLLGPDPLFAASAAFTAAKAAAAAADRTDPVPLSAGPTPADEYLRELAADHLIHAWDLAQALGRNLRLDNDLIDAVTTWFAPDEETYRAQGMTGPRPPLTADPEPQTLLLAMFGRSEALAAVDRFEAAFAAKNVDAVMAAMTGDCVFESTTPPDGTRHVGAAAVRAFWEEFFAEPGVQEFTPESRLDAGDHVVVRWRYTWLEGHVRGIDVFQVRNGLIKEKLSYVKG